MASGLWRNSFSSESAITRIMKSPKLKSKTKFNKHKNGKDGKGPGQPSSEDGLQPAKYNANQEYSTPPQSTTNTNSSTSDTGSVFSGSGSAYDSNSYNTPSASDKKTSASSGTN
ncbi:MAG: hypothetical protein ABIZ51_03815 [Bacteroidia bacterium]